MKRCFSISALRRCGLITRELWKNRKYTQILYVVKIAILENSEGFSKWGKERLKNTWCSFHHEVYKSLFVLWWKWYRCVVKHKWFSRVHILSLQRVLYRSVDWNKALALVHSELHSTNANPEVSLGSSSGKRMGLFWCRSTIGIQTDLELWRTIMPVSALMLFQGC